MKSKTVEGLWKFPPPLQDLSLDSPLFILLARSLTTLRDTCTITNVPTLSYIVTVSLDTLTCTTFSKLSKWLRPALTKDSLLLV